MKIIATSELLRMRFRGSEVRKQLARELDVHAGADGTAEQNIALQKAVMRSLAENGGRVPDSLRHRGATLGWTRSSGRCDFPASLIRANPDREGRR